MPKKYKPVVLIIFDGWGVAPPSEWNAISLANTPNFDDLIRHYPHSVITASGEAVGLSWQEMGNSEVGHMNIGSGRVVYQYLPRISRSITDGSFFKNEAFLHALEQVKKNNSKLHLLGLVSVGGVHSHIEHLYALLELAKREGIEKVYIHAITDGRDVPKDSALNFISELKGRIKDIGVGKIATLCGRYWSMDRAEHWERTKKAYDLMVEGKGEEYKSAEEALRDSYRKGIFDEELGPKIIDKSGLVSDNDALIFFNFRSDRTRQLTKAFILPGFEKFERKEVKNLFFVTMTEYEKDLPVEIAFPEIKMKNTLPEVISKAGLRQLHIAETEKFAHVTFFFACGRLKPFPGEDREIVASPEVASYDQQPEMSAFEVTDKLIKLINTGKYDFVVVNYANCDMVSHTGDISAAREAVEAVDNCLGRVVKTVLDLDGALVITADHGNAEVMRDPITGKMNKEHTTNPVPFIVVSNDRRKEIKPGETVSTDLFILSPVGVLADVAPTVLDLMGLKKPKEMTGISLLPVI